jgi:hypothetical protein
VVSLYVASQHTSTTSTTCGVILPKQPMDG